MSRIVLAHWNREEALERATRLEKAGHEVTVFTATDRNSLLALRRSPPEAFVIDLGRLPSHGRAIATALRQFRETRRVPIVFVGGEPEKVERARAELPDAVFTEWSPIRSALRRAIAHPLEDPLVPGTMDGYSGTPLPKKLGLRPGSRVLLLDAPEGFEERLAPLPDGARIHRGGRVESDLVVLFAERRSALDRQFPSAAAALAERGSVWIAWPKKASGLASDLSEPSVREYGLERGLVDYKVCAIDGTWSGLRFARRRETAGRATASRAAAASGGPTPSNPRKAPTTSGRSSDRKAPTP
jgi:CheY-like chemotaxis protein